LDYSVTREGWTSVANEFVSTHPGPEMANLISERA
jgi:hypothetical protein